MQIEPYSAFIQKLRALLQAPYTFIEILTYEEDRALSILRSLGKHLNREVKEWSAVTGFEGSPSNGDFVQALRHIESAPLNHIFVLKDCEAFFNDETTVRRLRELESNCAALSKTIIFLGPVPINQEKLSKDLTRLLLPLPDREAIMREFEKVFVDLLMTQDPNPIDPNSIVQGAMGLTVKEAHRAFHRLKVQFLESREKNTFFDIERAILEEKKQLVNASDALEFHPLDLGLDDVGGLNALKDWLKERKEAFSEEAKSFGLPTPKGVLLIGVQGCGKSLSAKVIGRHWGLPLLRLDLGSVFDGRQSPEESLRHALSVCDAIAPCVLWLDEIEKGFDSSDGRTSRVLGSLLTWQQEKDSPVFLVATANDVSRLPPELLRKGRFDEIFFVDLPEFHERISILKIHLLRRGRLIDDAGIEKIAELTEHYSGAEIEQIVISAMYGSFTQRRHLNVEDLIFATRESVPLFRTYEESIKGLREWADGRARRASSKRKILDFFQ